MGKVISWVLNIVNHENGHLAFFFYSALIEHQLLDGGGTHVFSDKFVHLYGMWSLLE